jgi:hypothetical protein
MTLELFDWDAITGTVLKPSDDLAKTSELWAHLVEVSALFARRVFQHSEPHTLGTTTYDNLFDICGAAEELRVLHTT